MKSVIIQFTFVFLLYFLTGTSGTRAQSFDYRTPDEVITWMERLQGSYPGLVSATRVAESPGNRPLYIIRIGKLPEKNQLPNPSVFVVANLEGNRPLASEGAIFLAEKLLSDPAHYDSLDWYILPCGNPDAAAGYFRSPLYEDTRNDLPVNDDQDDLSDEDGVNDLNGDGWITKMRVLHPDGEWITAETDSRLMQRADPKKGEQGAYKLYTEGTDDDGDGSFNEDGPGGTNVGINFPQFFRHYTSEGGLFPGSAPESYAIMKFVFEHPEIAMMVSFGSTNWCYTPPKGGRKGEADLSNIRLTEEQARQLNLDHKRSYTLSELVEFFRAENPQSDMDEGRLLGFLDLSAAVNPQEGDLLFYNKYASEYKAYLKARGTVEERIEPEPARDGSFEHWGYFQVGVPVFSMDLWGIPKKDSAAAEEALLAFADSQPGHPGFADWESFDHPTLGKVEIGGFVPFAGTTPPRAWADSLLDLQIPWILKLAGELPDLHIYEIRSTPKGNGIYQLDIWIENRAFIPFPTAMGSRNRQPAPAVLVLEGEQVNFISGIKRTPILRVDGKSRVKTTLLIQKEKAGEIKLRLESTNAGQDLRTINLGG